MGYFLRDGGGSLGESAVSAEALLRPWPDRAWSVLHTRSRAEKALAREALRATIP